MADDLRVHEDPAQRQAPDVRTSVKIWRRVYNFPREAVTSLTPARGTAVDLDGLAAQTDPHLRYRVLRTQEAQQTGGGKIQVVIWYYQVIPYS